LKNDGKRSVEKRERTDEEDIAWKRRREEEVSFLWLAAVEQRSTHIQEERKAALKEEL